MRISILVVLGLALLCSGCPGITPKIKPASEIVVNPPDFLDKPLDFPREERETVAKIVSSGHAIGTHIYENGTQAGSQESRINLELWKALEVWVGVVESVRVQTLEEARKLVNTLAEVSRKTRQTQEEWWVDYQKKKAEYEDLKEKNILIAKDKADTNRELLERREKQAELEKKLDEYRSKDRRFLFWGINLFGILGAGAVVFIFLRFGMSMGIGATVLVAALYLGGMASYIWQTHPEFVKLALGIGLGLLILGGAVYLFWGLFVEKMFKQQVEVHQEVRRKLPEETREIVDKMFDDEGESDLARNMLIKHIKRVQNIDPVT